MTEEKYDFPPLKYYKIYEDSQDLLFGTTGAACFDVAAYLKLGNNNPEIVSGYSKFNQKIQRTVCYDKMETYSDDSNNGYICIQPKERVLIPSGLILDIPGGYSVRTHPRSSTGYKIGMHHPHDEGIVDEDYFFQLFLLFYNMTEVEIIIHHDQKIVQAEMVEKPKYQILETKIEPSQKTDRVGGFGSTG